MVWQQPQAVPSHTESIELLGLTGFLSSTDVPQKDLRHQTHTASPCGALPNAHYTLCISIFPRLECVLSPALLFPSPRMCVDLNYMP